MLSAVTCRHMGSLDCRQSSIVHIHYWQAATGCNLDAEEKIGVSP